jgi:hypothetical protein
LLAPDQLNILSSSKGMKSAAGELDSIASPHSIISQSVGETIEGPLVSAYLRIINEVVIIG